MLRTSLVAVLIALLVPAAAVPGGGKDVQSGVKCTIGVGGFPGGCTDPVGDVKGGPGPDITRVTEYQWGVMIFKVTFAKAPALAHNAAYTDAVSISIAAIGSTTSAPLSQTTRHYVLSLSAKDRTHEVLRRLPDGKPQIMAALRAYPRAVTLGVNLHVLGDPEIVRYRVKASREMLNGTPGSSDVTPNTGTMEWH